LYQQLNKYNPQWDFSKPRRNEVSSGLESQCFLDPSGPFILGRLRSFKPFYRSEVETAEI